MSQLEYSIYSWPGMEPLDAIEMHVLARAYWAAWRSLHARDPAGRHVIASLDVVIVFGPRPLSASAAQSAAG
jgi:hypothetical protein